jgi:cleavage and polyadenylation specificity factor subunit 3
MGSLAVDPPKPGNTLSGILVKRNFNYLLLEPSDLSSIISFAA